MSSMYDPRQRRKLDFIFATVLIAVASVIVSDLLIKDLAREERQKIEVWNKAIRVMTSENPSLSMNLTLKIIQGNTSIPVILCSETDNIVSYNNIGIPEKNVTQLMTNKVKELRIENPPIVIDMEDSTYQYLYYDDSIILKRLFVYPYAQLSIVFVFILIAFLALASTREAEQNKVQVGLSEEMAHQLGAPISSLIAWVEYLRTKDIDPSLLTEMDKDMKRLQTIAGRFSKIGSDSDPVLTNTVEFVRAALRYMETYISSKVKINTYLPERPILVLMSNSLFAWVIKNLTKNAVDVMEGQGETSLKIKEREKVMLIDLVDTGKGIPKSEFRTVFNPGYMTRRRGWRLSLSLVKCIIESFQGGKIFVESSRLGKGATFRIRLEKYKG